MQPPHPNLIAQLKERRPEIADFILRSENNYLSEDDFHALNNSLKRLSIVSLEYDLKPLYALVQELMRALQNRVGSEYDNIITLSKTLLNLCNAMLKSKLDGSTLSLSTTSLPFSSLSFKPKLLSIDDDRIIHVMITSMFRDHADVLTAHDGKEGLEMIRRHKPHLVLLDDMMPQMTGMKMIEILQQDTELRKIPVIMLTSSDRARDIDRAMNAGAQGYVIKPFDPLELSQTVFKLLQKSF